MKCIKCFNPITDERLEALNVLGKAPEEYLCLSCAESHIKPIKGLYMGESGSSPLIFCNEVSNDRVVREDINKYAAEKDAV